VVDIIYLARTRSTLVWAALVAATIGTWWLGVHSLPGLEDVGGGVGAFVIFVAMIKVRFVAIHFMEIGNAPLALRLIVELYCVALLSVISILLLVT
jgi:hypothetical protein